MMIYSAVEIIARDIGPIDVLVNCAGTSYAGSIESLDVSVFEHLMRVNYLGTVHLTKAALPFIPRNSSDGSKIIIVASQIAQVAIHGYTAYAGSKWALRGFAEALQMEVKPHQIFVSVCYPPDTDTEGYREEMKTKPAITRKLSEAGKVFSPEQVAAEMIRGAEQRHFSVSVGLDGWLLKQVHPGMSPVNSGVEVLQQLLMSSLARFIGIFYILAWDAEVARFSRPQPPQSQSQSHSKVSSSL